MIEAKNIGVFFSEREWIFRNINVEIKEKDFFLITGPSGSGKTTLLHILASLLHPQEGEVLFKGESIYQLTETEILKLRQNYFSFLFQNDFLLNELTVAENIFLPLELEKGKITVNKWIYYEENLNNFAQQLEIKDLLSLSPEKLSPGQKQRIAFCRAILKEPKVIFMDEPFSNLDLKNKEILAEIIIDYWKKGNTLIMVTHEDDLITEYSKKLILG